MEQESIKSQEVLEIEEKIKQLNAGIEAAANAHHKLQYANCIHEEFVHITNSLKWLEAVVKASQDQVNELKAKLPAEEVKEVKAEVVSEQN